MRLSNIALAISALYGGFSPASLFAGGTVAGAWYDPSDLGTMFTTSAGTTPVAMPGQGSAVSVGLMLDKSQGLVLGANVLGSVWSTLGGAVASGSSVTFNSVSDIAAFQSVMTAGVRYLVSFDYNITSGQAGLYVGTNGGTGAAIIDLSGLSGTGSFSGYFIAGTGLFIFRDGTGCVASFTNITLRAQLGNHAIAANDSTKRPVLMARVNLLVATATLSTQSVTTQATSYTLSFAGTGSITLSGTATGSYSAGTHTITCTAGTLTLTVSGTVTTADLRPANSGALLPAYQAVVDANTYDTSGFPLYLRFDGIDDSMYTPASIPFATVTSDGQARRNLLSFPTVFNDPFWTVSGTTVSANSTTAPDGTTTADTLTETAAAGSHQIYNTSQLMGVPTPLCMSVYVKPNGRTWVFLGDDGGGVFFNLIGAGSVGTQQAGRTGSISSVGDGWYRVVVTGNRPAVNDSVYIALCSADNTLSYTGNGTSGVFIWGAQFEAGSTATAFQNIGTDKMSVFAGVRKFGTTVSVYAELSAASFANAGSFGFYPENIANSWTSGLRGASNTRSVDATTYVSPSTSVVSTKFDIAQSLTLNAIEMRVNGATGTVTPSDPSANLGGGNFGTYPLYIGARNNNSVWFNGHLHSLIIAGSAVSAGNISATEQWVAGKTGIVI